MSLDTAGERILVLGAGELGMAVLRALAHRAGRSGAVGVSVLLRPAAIASDDPAKRRDIARQWADIKLEPVQPADGALTQ